jgi:hypothetical protein
VNTDFPQAQALGTIHKSPSLPSKPRPYNNQQHNTFSITSYKPPIITLLFSNSLRATLKNLSKHTTMDNQPFNIFVLTEPDSTENWNDTAIDAKYALIKQFARGDLQVYLRPRYCGTCIDSIMVAYLCASLQEAFECNFNVRLVEELDMWIFTADEVPQLRDPDIMLNVPSGFELFFAKAPADKTPKKSTGLKAKKNPPRPMNCWLLFRDDMHKKLKASNPELSVQAICKLFNPCSQVLSSVTSALLYHALTEIATICSNKWKVIPQVEKDIWTTKARQAKALHALLYPNYKYEPRKPGQKKKRQSRKAKETVASAYAAGATVASSPATSSDQGLHEDFGLSEFTGPMTSSDNLDFGSSEFVPDALFDFDNAVFHDPSQPLVVMSAQTPLFNAPTSSNSTAVIASAQTNQNANVQAPVFQAPIPGNNSSAATATQATHHANMAAPVFQAQTQTETLEAAAQRLGLNRPLGTSTSWYAANPVDRRPPIPAEELYYAEALRQQRLEAEFGHLYNTPEERAEERAGRELIFRTGANGDATLTTVYRGHF